MLFWLSGALLIAASVLGGGTHTGFVGDVILQLMAVPLLLAGLWRWFEDVRDESRALNWPIVLIVGLLAMFVIQLIPLPSDIWALTPAAKLATSGLDAVSLDTIWRPISLAPHATLAAAISFLVPIAMFIGVAQLDAGRRLKLCWIVLGVSAIALLLGLLQVAQGPHSALRLFAITNDTEAVGFFANRNHFAAHLYVALVLTAVWFVSSAHSALEPGAINTKAILGLAAAAALVFATAGGLAVARSRAGMIIAMAAIFGIAMMAIANRRLLINSEESDGTGWRASHVAIIVGTGAIAFVAQFGLHRFLTRFQMASVDELRSRFAATTFETASQLLPFGSGLGSFVPVYSRVEKASDVFQRYANRAHNDYLEYLLEAGLFGALLALAFLAWFALRAFAIWFRPAEPRSSNDAMLQQAATIIIALLLVHSMVDYPLRTTALGVLFAFACALLLPAPQPEPVFVAPSRKRAAPRPLREMRAPAMPQAVPRSAGETPGPVLPPARAIPAPVMSQAVPKAAAKRWGKDVTWPDAWKPQSGNRGTNATKSDDLDAKRDS